MTSRPRLPAPIVPVAAALIAGAAWGGARPVQESAVVAACLLAGASLATRRRVWIATVLAVAAAFAIGAALQGFAWRAAGARLDRAFAGAVMREVSCDGRVVAAPERNREGGRSLLVKSTGRTTGEGLELRIDVVNVPPDDAPRFDSLRRGDVVRIWCRLRAATSGPGVSAEEARRRLAAQRIDATARVKSSRLVTLMASGGMTPGRWLDDARCRARNALDRSVGPMSVARGVLGAMLLGDRLLLDDDANNVLRDAGLIHILSISGLHTALSVLLILALLRRTGLGARGLLFAGGASLVAFSAFVGHGASVWRACAGLGVGLAARVLAREVEPLAALALASAALVVAVPPLAWSAGFLLSVTATAGLVAASPKTAADERAPSVVARSLSASLGAYLATAPLLALLFNRLAPAAFIANLFAAPLCAFCLAAGAAAIAFASVPFAGACAAAAAKLSVEALLLVSRLAATLPGGHLRVASPGSVLTCAYVVVLLVAGFWDSSWSRRGGRAVKLVLALIVIALHLGTPPPGPGSAALTVVDVGQGLAVVLRGTDGRFVLVDAGPSGNGRVDSGDRIVVPALVTAGCRRLEVLALSHDHDDHAGGALAILRDLEVAELWVGAGSERDPLTKVVAAEAVARGVAVRRLKRGDRFLRAGLEFVALHPGVLDRRRPPNDRCLVLRAAAEDGATMLLPGDLEATGERAMLEAGSDPRADVLVAPHHGANGSSSALFLARVAPQFVLVSAGEGNRFGHPGTSALARMAAVSARVWRTDRDGSITLDETEGRWRTSVERERRRDESQDEDDGQNDREDDAARP